MNSRDFSDIGFVGLGNMGLPMTWRLSTAGYQLIVWNRSVERYQRLADSCVPADNLSDLAAKCTIIVSCLSGDDAVHSVYLGHGGILKNARKGTITIEHGTISPSLCREIEKRAARRGVTFLDAPVTGGPEGSSQGTLTTMVGGDLSKVTAISPVLKTYSSRIINAGPSGYGNLLKLVNQLLVTCHVVAAAEALQLLNSLKIPIEVAEEALSSGWAASAMLTRAFQQQREQDMASGAPIIGLHQLQSIISDLASQNGLRLPLTSTAGGELLRAVESGGGSADVGALAHHL